MNRKPQYDRARLRLLSVLLIVLAVAALALMGWREIVVRRGVYESILEDRGATTAREIDAFFGPIREQLAVIRSWGEGGALELDDRAALDTRFTPILRSYGWTSELAIVGQDGLEYRLVAIGDTVESTLELSDAFDLHESEWYEEAHEPDAGQAGWSIAPSESGASGAPFFAATAWVDPDERRVRRVIALGISRVALDGLIDAFRVTEGGMMALVSLEAGISWYMPAAGPHFNQADAEEVLHATDSPRRLLAEALYASTHSNSTGRHYRFRHEGDRWWGWRGPLATGDGTRELLFLLPEADLSDRLMTTTSPMTYGLLLLFGICVVLLVRTTQGLRGRLERMTGAATHSLSNEVELRTLIDSGESDHLEFKSTLRWNIKENRPGKEIELSWLKTVVAFLNTEGGTLLVGVDDAGRIVGCTPDGFRNADKYLLHVNNLLQRHIGVEFSRYLRYDLRPIKAEHILVVDVFPSDAPVFLRNNDDDLFYVRVGPASRKLSLRKTLEYLKEFEDR